MDFSLGKSASVRARPNNSVASRCTSARTRTLEPQAQVAGSVAKLATRLGAANVARECYRGRVLHVRKPMMVLASSILPVAIMSATSRRVNQRVSMRSSSMGVAVPAVRSVAR